ncbi:MAG: hypothetical protein QW083_00490 [Methanomassiliicoccales archaeon]
MMEAIICKDYLMAVLNEMLLSGVERFVVQSELLDLPLLNLNIKKKKIDTIVDQKNFDDAVSQVNLRISSKKLQDEIPDYSDLKEALQSSLQLPSNASELALEFKDIERKSNNTLRFPRSKCIGVDTNIIYKRLMSRLQFHSDFSDLFDDGRARNFMILIPDLVRMEITANVKEKYAKQDVEELYRALDGKKILRSLFNCCNKKGRKALLALTELKIIKDMYTCIDVPGGEFHQNKEQRDAEILRVLAGYADAQKLDLVFVTADDKCRAHALANKVGSIWLDYAPIPFFNHELNEWLLVELLYDLSVIFCAISFKDLGIRILGDWSGKTTNDFYAENLKLLIEEGSSLEQNIQRDLKILDRIQEVADIRCIK